MERRAGHGADRAGSIVVSAARTAPITIPAVMADGRLVPIEKMEAHRSGQLHLAVSVFVFDENGRLLVQRRAASKYHCGGLWANTCCTHPHWDEIPSAAAPRRLREELGVAGVDLVERRTIDYRADVGGGLVEHERVTFYEGRVEADELTFDLDPAEVDAVDWWDASRLADALAREPEMLTPWFRIYLERFPGLAI